MGLDDFIRLEDGFETAIKTYSSKDKDLCVVLAGTVHHGLPEYYLSIEDSMKEVDRVLYEDAVGVEWLNFFECITPGYLWSTFGTLELKDLLRYNSNLIDQHDDGLIDVMYNDPRWIRCDYTFPEIVHHLNRLYLASPVKMLSDFRKLFLRDRNWREIRKNIDKESFNQVYAERILSEGKEKLFLDKVLIEMRNQWVGKWLKSISKGTNRIGIVYGPAHMPDLEQFLIDELGLEKTDERWVRAWDF